MPWQEILTQDSTPFGCYKFLRMHFGINSAWEVFQLTMDQLFAGYPWLVIVDEIIVGGLEIAEHHGKRKKVLERLKEINLKLNPHKCKFRLDQVSYVSHIFTSRGLKAEPSETVAFTDKPVPTDVTLLQRFLGMLNYFGKYIPNNSNIKGPLRKLTHKEMAWCWFHQHQEAFDRLKEFKSTSLGWLRCQTASHTCLWHIVLWNSSCLHAKSQIEKEPLTFVFDCT